MASFEEKETELEREVRIHAWIHLSNPMSAEASAEALLNDLVDTVILGIVFEIHRAAKTGLVDKEEGIAEEQNAFDIAEEGVGDIFGQQLAKKTVNPVCPNCKRSKAAVRFAKHLENCMGMGRK